MRRRVGVKGSGSYDARCSCLLYRVPLVVRTAPATVYAFQGRHLHRKGLLRTLLSSSLSSPSSPLSLCLFSPWRRSSSTTTTNCEGRPVHATSSGEHTPSDEALKKRDADALHFPPSSPPPAHPLWDCFLSELQQSGEALECTSALPTPSDHTTTTPCASSPGDETAKPKATASSTAPQECGRTESIKPTTPNKKRMKSEAAPGNEVDELGEGKRRPAAPHPPTRDDTSPPLRFGSAPESVSEQHTIPDWVDTVLSQRSSHAHSKPFFYCTRLSECHAIASALWYRHVPHFTSRPDERPVKEEEVAVAAHQHLDAALAWWSDVSTRIRLPRDLDAIEDLALFYVSQLDQQGTTQMALRKRMHRNGGRDLLTRHARSPAEHQEETLALEAALLEGLEEWVFMHSPPTPTSTSGGGGAPPFQAAEQDNDGEQKFCSLSCSAAAEGRTNLKEDVQTSKQQEKEPGDGGGGVSSPSTALKESDTREASFSSPTTDDPLDMEVESSISFTRLLGLLQSYARYHDGVVWGVGSDSSPPSTRSASQYFQRRIVLHPWSGIHCPKGGAAQRPYVDLLRWLLKSSSSSKSSHATTSMLSGTRSHETPATPSLPLPAGFTAADVCSQSGYLMDILRKAGASHVWAVDTDLLATANSEATYHEQSHRHKQPAISSPSTSLLPCGGASFVRADLLPISDASNRAAASPNHLFGVGALKTVVKGRREEDGPRRASSSSHSDGSGGAAAEMFEQAATRRRKEAWAAGHRPHRTSSRSHPSPTTTEVSQKTDQATEEGTPRPLDVTSSSCGRLVLPGSPSTSAVEVDLMVYHPPAPDHVLPFWIDPSMGPPPRELAHTNASSTFPSVYTAAEPPMRSGNSRREIGKGAVGSSVEQSQRRAASEQWWRNVAKEVAALSRHPTGRTARGPEDALGALPFLAFPSPTPPHPHHSFGVLEALLREVQENGNAAAAGGARPSTSSSKRVIPPLLTGGKTPAPSTSPPPSIVHRGIKGYTNVSSERRTTPIRKGGVVIARRGQKKQQHQQSARVVPGASASCTAGSGLRLRPGGYFICVLPRSYHLLEDMKAALAERSTRRRCHSFLKKGRNAPLSETECLSDVARHILCAIPPHENGVGNVDASVMSSSSAFRLCFQRRYPIRVAEAAAARVPGEGSHPTPESWAWQCLCPAAASPTTPTRSSNNAAAEVQRCCTETVPSQWVDVLVFQLLPQLCSSPPSLLTTDAVVSLAQHTAAEALASVEWEDTMDYDEYLPQQLPTQWHWLDRMPTFSYLEQDFVRHKGEEGSLPNSNDSGNGPTERTASPPVEGNAMAFGPTTPARILQQYYASLAQLVLSQPKRVPLSPPPTPPSTTANPNQAAITRHWAAVHSFQSIFRKELRSKRSTRKFRHAALSDIVSSNSVASASRSSARKREETYVDTALLKSEGAKVELMNQLARFPFKMDEDH